MSEIGQYARVMGIVLDDQQYGIAGIEDCAVVRQLLDRQIGQPRSRQARWGGRRHGAGGPRACRRWGNIFERQIQRKGAANAWHAAQLKLAAEQV